MPRQEEKLENGIREMFILKREGEIQSKEVLLNNCEIKYHMTHTCVKRRARAGFFLFQNGIFLPPRPVSFPVFYEWFVFSVAEGGPLDLVLPLSGC